MISALIRDRLIDEGVVGSATQSGSAWVCLVGGLSDQIDAPQVAVRDTAGFSPLSSHDSRSPLRPGFQILVRGSSNSYNAANQKAQEVWDVLHRRPFGDVVIAIDGVNNPIWLGLTSDDDRPTWSLNFVAFLIKE